MDSINLDDKYWGNPWHKSISNITWGFMLTSMTFNFLALQYILPRCV